MNALAQINDDRFLFVLVAVCIATGLLILGYTWRLHQTIRRAESDDVSVSLRINCNNLVSQGIICMATGITLLTLTLYFQ